MRWKSKSSSPPKVGDTRIVRRFFLFPRCFHNTWVWLERCRVVQTRVEEYEYVGIGFATPYDVWRITALVNK